VGRCGKAGSARLLPFTLSKADARQPGERGKEEKRKVTGQRKDREKGRKNVGLFFPKASRKNKKLGGGGRGFIKMHRLLDKKKTTGGGIVYNPL